ncbi:MULTISPECIES: hypothetical protein [Fusobacterium]|uniref:hypothetical protein n=1 Tax=Fusobacterium TaxID=848 RepID=UPI001F365C4A|nr:MULTISPECIES: hypothetical protein [Fusobacterium]MCF2612638.1 hypothetical protein [Fusobacterium perfoetens]MDY2981470.1 hypothetical protein [Fusobacterium sp.]
MLYSFSFYYKFIKSLIYEEIDFLGIKLNIGHCCVELERKSIEKKSLLCYTLVKRYFFSQLISLKIIDQKGVELGRTRKSRSLANKKYKKLV